MSAYEWQKFYRAAVLETDKSKLQDRIAEARLAIGCRVMNGLARESNKTEENDIQKALVALTSLESEGASKKSGTQTQSSHGLSLN
jgi:hypothetical protein